MSKIRMENVSKQFSHGQSYCNIYDFNFEIQDGEFFCLVGPTSSGKTTTLRLIAGLEKPDRGHIHIDDLEVSEVPPSRRQIAMLFETLALYPNRNGFGNLASPLQVKKMPKIEIESRVGNVAKLLKIEHLLDRTPETYSGGEKQRMALGRILVQRARAYLLDEPLGGLDARLRVSMRSELKRLQRELGQTMIFVSHDQEEVMSLGTRIGVLKEGKIQQIGTPSDLYLHPFNCCVAKSIGKPMMNFYECTLQQEAGKVFALHPCFKIDLEERLKKAQKQPREEKVVLGIRPEDIEIKADKQIEEDIEAKVFISEPLGSKAIVDLKMGNESIRALISSGRLFELNEAKWLRFNREKIHIFEKGSEQTIF
jgi:multiple sugar transport system ATP-binding protein